MIAIYPTKLISIQKHTMEASHDVISGIDNFEKTLKNFTFDNEQSKSKANAAANSAVSLTTASPNLTASTVSPLLSTTKKDVVDDSKAYLQRIKVLYIIASNFPKRTTG